MGHLTPRASRPFNLRYPQGPEKKGGLIFIFADQFYALLGVPGIVDILLKRGNIQDAFDYKAVQDANVQAFVKALFIFVYNFVNNSGAF